MIAQTRDIVFGKGERKLTYMMIMVWYKYYPTLAIYAVYRLVDLLYLPTVGAGDDMAQYLNTYVGSRKHSFGCWKDIKYFCYYIASNSKQRFDHPLIDVAVSIMNDQVMRDWTVLDLYKNLPLMRVFMKKIIQNYENIYPLLANGFRENTRNLNGYLKN